MFKTIKQYAKPDFILGFMIFCVIQPTLLIMAVSVFVVGLYQTFFG